MDKEEIKRKDLEALLEELEGMRGRHTELVSVYIPKGFQIYQVAQQLRNEQSTAQNIKSKATKKNVMGALEKILQHLKLYKQTPENGLAVFAGNVAIKEGSGDIELWAIEPPEPITQRLYWCGQTFIVDPLKEIFREKEIYGLIVIDKGDAAIGLLAGQKVIPLKVMDSIVPGKTKAGGWSQARYARIREGLLEDFLKKAGDIASDLFKDQKDLIGIIIGGPGPIKENFAKGDYLNYQMKNRIMGVVSTSYTKEPGLQEMVERAEEILAEASFTREKKIMERFLTELGKESGLGVYGILETTEQLNAGNLELLVISEDFDWHRAKYKCGSCGHEHEKILRESSMNFQKCDKCGFDIKEMEEHPIMKHLIEKAEEMGTLVEMISKNSPMGKQLIALGGVGGILRYKT